MRSNTLSISRRHFDMKGIFSILERASGHRPPSLRELCGATALSPTTVRRRLVDIRSLGIVMHFDRPSGGYRIHDWGHILRPAGIRNGHWRQLTEAARREEAARRRRITRQIP